jgi:hypothetical protein
MMPIAERYFKNGEHRARTAIKFVLAALVIGVVLILVGILWLKKSVDDYAELSQKRWTAFGNYNPGIIIPQIVDANKLVVPSAPSPSIIEAATPTPTPTPSPTPSPTQTPSPVAKAIAKQQKRSVVRRARVRPTPTPAWFQFFNQTR